MFLTELDEHWTYLYINLGPKYFVSINFVSFIGVPHNEGHKNKPKLHQRRNKKQCPKQLNGKNIKNIWQEQLNCIDEIKKEKIHMDEVTWHFHKRKYYKIKGTDKNKNYYKFIISLLSMSQYLVISYGIEIPYQLTYNSTPSYFLIISHNVFHLKL